MKRLVKIAIPVIIFYFLFRAIFVDWQETKSYLLSINTLWLLAAFIVMFLIHAENAYSWFVIVKRLKPSAKLKIALPVWIISNTSRYIPGTVWQYLGRIELASKWLGLGRSLVGLSLIYEIFLSLASGAILSLFIILYSKAIPNWLIIPGLIAAIVFLRPKFVSFVMDLMIKILKKKFSNLEVEHDFSAIYKSLPWFILRFLLGGLAFVFLANAIGINVSINNILLFSSYYAFSWMVGFLTLIAPGGIGVMEGTMTVMLSSIMPASQAGIIALMYRFFLTATEAIAFVFCLYKLRK